MLKLFHTADWHLGHTLHGVSRYTEHQQFLNWLLAELLAKQADALIVAGDIFDSANPSA
jgi:exonuclease SbcD